MTKRLRYQVLFNNLLNSLGDFKPVNSLQMHSPVDIYLEGNDEDILKIQYACVGLDKEDILIKIEGETLNVSTSHKEIEEEDKVIARNYLTKSISSKPFQHSYKVSKTFDLDSMKVDLSKGLLTLTIPKSKSSKMKIIKIE